MLIPLVISSLVADAAGGFTAYWVAAGQILLATAVMCGGGVLLTVIAGAAYDWWPDWRH